MADWKCQEITPNGEMNRSTIRYHIHLKVCDALGIIDMFFSSFTPVIFALKRWNQLYSHIFMHIMILIILIIIIIIILMTLLLFLLQYFHLEYWGSHFLLQINVTVFVHLSGRVTEPPCNHGRYAGKPLGYNQTFKSLQATNFFPMDNNIVYSRVDRQ